MTAQSTYRCRYCGNPGITVVVGDSPNKRLYCSMSCKVAHDALLAGEYVTLHDRLNALKAELDSEREARRAMGITLPGDIEFTIQPASHGGLDTTNEPWPFPGDTDWVRVPCHSEQEFNDRVARLYEQSKWHTEGYPVEGKECLVTARFAERKLAFVATARHYDHDDWSGWRASFGPVEWGKWEVLAWREMPEPYQEP